MLSDEIKENLRQTYHWVTSLSEDSLEFLNSVRKETRSVVGDAALANSVWCQLDAYKHLYGEDPGIGEAQFLLDYSKGKPWA